MAERAMHAGTVALTAEPSSVRDAFPAQHRAKPLVRREHVPGMARAREAASLIVGRNVYTFSSIRRAAARLRVTTSRMHAMTDTTQAQTLSVADVLFLHESTDAEGRAIAAGVWTEVGEQLGLVYREDLAPKRETPREAEQLDLFGVKR